MNLWRDQRGSAPAEFVMVGALLTVLTLAILQFGLAIYVRNIVQDAAVEGAFHAALADTSLHDGEARVRELVDRAVAGDVLTGVSAYENDGSVTMTVTATLPILGFWGIPQGIEVTGSAPVETLDR